MFRTATALPWSVDAAMLTAALLAWSHGWIAGTIGAPAAGRFVALGVGLGFGAVLAARSHTGARLFVAGVYALAAALIMSIASSVAW